MSESPEHRTDSMCQDITEPPLSKAQPADEPKPLGICIQVAWIVLIFMLRKRVSICLVLWDEGKEYIQLVVP